MNIKQLTILSISLIILGLLYLVFSMINMNNTRHSMLVYNLIFGIASFIAGAGTGIFLLAKKDKIMLDSMDSLLSKLNENSEFPFELDKFYKYCGVSRDKASNYLDNQSKILLQKHQDSNGKIIYNLPEKIDETTG